MATFEINWLALSFAIRGEDRRRCANPFCSRVAGDGHAFCPRCRAHGIVSLETLVDGFIAGRRGEKFEMPRSSRDFFSKFLGLAAERGLISDSYAKLARSYHTTLENLEARLTLLWFNVQLHQESLAKEREAAIVAEAVQEAASAISSAEMQVADVAEALGEAAARATMEGLEANHPECLQLESPNPWFQEGLDPNSFYEMACSRPGCRNLARLTGAQIVRLRGYPEAVPYCQHCYTLFRNGAKYCPNAGKDPECWGWVMPLHDEKGEPTGGHYPLCKACADKEQERESTTGITPRGVVAVPEGRQEVETSLVRACPAPAVI